MIYYNGKAFSDFSIHTDNSQSFESAPRSVETASVPGRSGDLRFDDNRYANIPQKYNCFIRQGFKRHYQDFIAFLMQDGEYHKLRDTAHPDVYRMAAVDAAPTYTTGAFNESGQFTVTFNCKPQKYLIAGERATEISSGSVTLWNPTNYEAKPLIRVYGNGTVSIGSYLITVANDPFDYIDIDCDVMDCMNGISNANKYVTLSGYEFPVLGKGTTKITVSGTAEITPRWWTI